ncbi:MAG: hypothetical protein HY543_01040 [Deltaproteobacteria bacterium]|nr:hypothetical protein [Deltaproteobacteria bacterium]
MTKRSWLAISGLCFSVAACRASSVLTTAGGRSAPVAATADAAAARPAAAKKDLTPYVRTIQIYEEFARMVETHQKSPEAGIAACRQYVRTVIPEVQALTEKIRSIETSDLAATYLPDIMETNSKIKSATEKVTELAEKKYGQKGSDVILILSDLALARL